MKTNTKEWVQYSTATGMVLSGAILAYLSFFINGEVTDGVLWYVAQALTFAGGIFGVSVYFRTKLGETKTELFDYIQKTVGKKQSDLP